MKRKTQEKPLHLKFSIFVIRNVTSLEIFYTFRYPEFKGHKNQPWVIRQMGIYHRFNKIPQSSPVSNTHPQSALWILFNPRPQSAAQQRVLACLQQHQHQHQRLASLPTAQGQEKASMPSLMKMSDKYVYLHPLWLHVVIYESYVMGWRGYLAAYEGIVLPVVGSIESCFVSEVFCQPGYLPTFQCLKIYTHHSLLPRIASHAAQGRQDK